MVMGIAPGPRLLNYESINILRLPLSFSGLFSRIITHNFHIHDKRLKICLGKHSNKNGAVI